MQFDRHKYEHHCKSIVSAGIKLVVREQGLQGKIRRRFCQDQGALPSKLPAHPKTKVSAKSRHGFRSLCIRQSDTQTFQPIVSTLKDAIRYITFIKHK